MWTWCGSSGASAASGSVCAAREIYSPGMVASKLMAIDSLLPSRTLAKGEAEYPRREPSRRMVGEPEEEASEHHRFPICSAFIRENPHRAERQEGLLGMSKRSADIVADRSHHRGLQCSSAKP